MSSVAVFPWKPRPILDRERIRDTLSEETVITEISSKNEATMASKTEEKPVAATAAADRSEQALELPPSSKKFILHWGEMGQAWGINRTMAEVHALLYIWPDALDAGTISKTLQVSRSNVSTSLRELIAWGVVRRVHQIRDRRDRFEALKDVMETFRTIMAERKRREMDPTLALLDNCVREAQQDPTNQYAKEQLEKMLEFLQSLSLWYSQIDGLSSGALRSMLLNGPKITKLFRPFLADKSKDRGTEAQARPLHEVSDSGVDDDDDGFDDDDEPAS